MATIDDILDEAPAVAPVIAALGEAAMTLNPTVGALVVLFAGLCKEGPQLEKLRELLTGTTPPPRVAELMAEGNTARKALVGP